MTFINSASTKMSRSKENACHFFLYSSRPAVTAARQPSFLPFLGPETRSPEVLMVSESVFFSKSTYGTRTLTLSATLSTSQTLLQIQRLTGKHLGGHSCEPILAVDALYGLPAFTTPSNSIPFVYSSRETVITRLLVRRRLRLYVLFRGLTRLCIDIFPGGCLAPSASDGTSVVTGCSELLTSGSSSAEFEISFCCANCC